MKRQFDRDAELKRVGLWIRVSTEDQAAGDSPAHHEARARHYAAAREWTVVEVYDLAGVSGKAVMEHPEAKRMMEDVRRGHISALMFSKLARLTRNARELMDFSDFFREHNADLVSLQENIDTSTPSGRLFYNIVAVMAQWEREEIADRVNASVAIRAKLGRPLNGKSPFGYVWKDKALQPDPTEAPVRKLIYELFSEHKRKKTVARLLNARGYRTRDGSQWSDTSVGRLIQDQTAKGIHRANYTRRTGDHKPYAIKPEHEWVLTEVEPIISKELWNRCNELLEERRTKRQRPGRRPVQLFGGRVVCECDRKMCVPSNTPKYVCPGCRNKIPVVDLEALFLDEIKGYALSPAARAEYVANANSAISEKQKLRDSLCRELEKVRHEADRAYDLYMQGGLTVEQFKSRYQPLDLRKKQLEEEVPRVEAELDVLKVDGLSEEEIMAELIHVHSRWPTMGIEERRRLVDLLLEKIVVTRASEIHFDLFYVPRFEELTERQRTLMDALPFCRATLQRKRCPRGVYFRQVTGYPTTPKTIGEMIRKRRLDLNLRQVDVANSIGCNETTVVNWEKNHTEPRITYLDAVVAFLGYDPFAGQIGTPTGKAPEDLNAWLLLRRTAA